MNEYSFPVDGGRCYIVIYEMVTDDNIAILEDLINMNRVQYVLWVQTRRLFVSCDYLQAFVYFTRAVSMDYVRCLTTMDAKIYCLLVKPEEIRTYLLGQNNFNLKEYGKLE